MIVYSATKDEFRADVRENRIEDAILTEFQRRLGHSTGQPRFARGRIPCST